MSEEQQKPFVRLCNPDTDKHAMIHIFRVTAGTALHSEPCWFVGQHIWCLPYIHLSPSYCFVLDDGSGNAVGYIIGTPDTADFARRWRAEYLPTLDKTALPPPDPSKPKPDWNEDRPGALLNILYSPEESLLYADFPSLLEKYPAHLHIDVLPDFQGRGYGRAMMDAFCSKVKSEGGAHGVHLGMVADNVGAEKFYRKVGFERYPEVLDGGSSGELGRTAHETLVQCKQL